MTFFLKYTDPHGVWFYRAPSRWSDSFADAKRFTDKDAAAAEALASTSRLKATNGFQGAPRVRVVSMRKGS